MKELLPLSPWSGARKLRTAILAAALGATVLAVQGLTRPAHAAPVFLSRSECRAGFWHVITYDISDPEHWIEIGDIPTTQPCGEILPPAIPTATIGTGLELEYHDAAGPGQIVIAGGDPDLETGQTPIDVWLYQNGRIYTGAGYQRLIHQDPPEVSDGVKVYELRFNVRSAFGARYEFAGQLQTGGILGRPLGSGWYDRVGGGDSGMWRLAAGSGQYLVAVHRHGPVADTHGACGDVPLDRSGASAAHDAGCFAGGLGAEHACWPITQGKYKGQYLCVHEKGQG